MFQNAEVDGMGKLSNSSRSFPLCIGESKADADCALGVVCGNAPKKDSELHLEEIT